MYTHPTQLMAYYQQFTSILCQSQIIQYAKQACAPTGPGSPRNQQSAEDVTMQLWHTITQ